MKKLGRITLGELKNQVTVLDKNEERECLGGTDYNGTPVNSLGTPLPDGHTWYTPDQAALLKSFGLWDGGYVLGEGYYADGSGITANAGMGSFYESWLTQMMSASMPTTSGIDMSTIMGNPSGVDLKGIYGMSGFSESKKTGLYNQALTVYFQMGL